MKITDNEISQNNVKSAPDTVHAEGEYSPREVKNIFDRLPELIAQKHNALVEYINEKIYTKAAVDAAINQKVTELGKGDMAQNIYDIDGNGMVDNAENGIYEYVQTDANLDLEAARGNFNVAANGKFRATSTGSYSEFTINGKNYAVRSSDETSIELTQNMWYSFFIDDENDTINFKAGGGVSNSKLALTTAAENHVISGKTFYSQDKTLKTGTVSSKAAETYGAKTTAQSIAAGQYLSGKQTIAAVTQSNLSASNIVKGKTVTIASNGSNLWSVAGTAVTAKTIAFTFAGGATQSSSVTLPAGTYSVIYHGFGQNTDSSPVFYIYAGGSLKKTCKTKLTYGDIDCTYGTTTFTLSSSASVYIKQKNDRTDGENYGYPHGICVIYRTA